MFLGREVEVDRILEDCRDNRLVVLVYEPGAGATTLLDQGVAPALRQDGFVTVGASNWQGRFFASTLKDEIVEAVREQADGHLLAANEELDAMLRRIRNRTGRKIALLLDQFEDYVRCHSGSDISDFFDAELAQAVANRQAAFVIAIHDHALPGFERLSQLIPNLLGHRTNLPPLSLGTARALITARAEQHGMTVEPSAIEALLAAPAVLNANGIVPYFLDRALTPWFDAEARLSSTVARLATIEAHGGADRLILESFDGSLRDMNVTHQDLFFRWCNVLISPPPRTRLAATEKGLAEYSGRLNRFALTLLPFALEKGLMRSVEMSDAVRYELARESLVPIIRDWWERREAFLIARRRAKFRVRSISVAVGSIVMLYLVWLLMTIKK